MEVFKIARLNGIRGEVKVNEDGTKITLNGKPVKIHIIKSERHTSGYYACSIEGRSFYVHRIVAEAYVPNLRPVKYRMVLHINGNTLDNHFENLEWGDAAALYKNRVRIQKPGVGVNTIDETFRGSSTISYDEALKIAERLDNGEFAKDICKEYGVSEMSIARIRKRYCKKKSASPRYDKEIKETVLKLAEKYSPNEVAKISGIKYHTVYRWLRNND
ncbi:MAG: helix-turn-helix domain-containing protein [Bacteroidales bacterium]|nr:helix-turn-helix domain-containing protein [Bacteroidales bacterium]